MTESLADSRGMAAGPHPLAAESGRMVLEAGGNAVDAAVASTLTLSVVTPHWVGLGGYGGCMAVHLAAEGRTLAIDFDARAPVQYTEAAMGDEPEAAAARGYLSVTAPAVVAGLAFALERCGTMSWAEVSEHAIRLAGEGFVVDAGLGAALKDLARTADPVSLRAAFPEGRPPAVGEVYVQSDLARLLRRLSEDGWRAFYEGDIPDRIVRQVRENGGVLTEEDFARCAAAEVTPLSVDYRGCAVMTCPPPSGGLTALQALKTLDQFDLAGMEPWGPEYLRVLIEALARSWQDRTALLGDPDFVQVPARELLSGETAQRAAEEIRAGQRCANTAGYAGSGHTIHTVAADREGNLVSLTATHGELFGSRAVIEGLGIALGHGMSRFEWRPGSPNAPAPGKRPQHNMSPVIILRDGRPYAALGLPGGRRIVSVTPQLVVNLLDFGISPADALIAPRIHTDGSGPVICSPGVSGETRRKLKAQGYDARVESAVGGTASAVVFDGDSIAGASGNGPECVGVALRWPG